jgi:hypothetical protein
MGSDPFDYDDEVPPPPQDTALEKRTAVEAAASVRYELEAMVATARMAPRSQPAVIAGLLESAKRMRFAEAAHYEFKRGKKKDAKGNWVDNYVLGPSVTLARPIAAAWGHIRFGWRIIGEDDTYVHLQGYAHDVQTGALRTQEDRFKKLQQRKDKTTGVTSWVKPDERDLRELLGRHGAILERNCILSIVPPDVVDQISDACHATMRGHASGKLKDEPTRKETIAKLLAGFAEFGVTAAMIEMHIGHSVETITPDELVSLRGVWNSIRDGASRVHDHFEKNGEPAPDVPRATIDLSKSKEGVAVDPPGGSPLGRPEQKQDDAAKPAAESIKLPGWFHKIELMISEPPSAWLDMTIAGKPPIGGMTYRTVAASKDKAVEAALLALLNEGAELQEKNGKTPSMYQRLAAACWLHDNGARVS